MSDRLALLDQAAVRSAISTELGVTIEYHARIGSTQDRARELVPGPAVIVADEQTQGRGTKDRRWLAAAGTSVLASFVLPGPPQAAPVASLVAGVAVARALDGLGVNGARLKWPNDVQLAGRKVAGILTQVSTGPAGHLIVGVGLNVAQDADALAALGVPATSLTVEGHGMDRLDAFAALTREFGCAFGGDPVEALDEWRRRSTVLGRRVVAARAGEGPVRGEAVALEPDGALLLETAYGPVRILTGEVALET